MSSARSAETRTVVERAGPQLKPAQRVPIEVGVNPLVLAATQFPFGITDIGLVAAGIATLLLLGSLGRRGLALLATSVASSAVAESDAARADGRPSLAEPARSGQPGEQAERRPDRERVVDGRRARAA